MTDGNTHARARTPTRLHTEWPIPAQQSVELHVAEEHTALSLATADAVGAKAPRHMALGQMYGAIGNVIGQGYDKDIVASFQTPICVNPGEFIAVTVRFLLGTATSLQEVVGIIGFEGYWE